MTLTQKKKKKKWLWPKGNSRLLPSLGSLPQLRSSQISLAFAKSGFLLDFSILDLQIYAVTPIPESQEVLQREGVPDNIKSFYKVNHIWKFRYDRPFHKGTKDKENEFKVPCVLITYSFLWALWNKPHDKYLHRIESSDRTRRDQKSLSLVDLKLNGISEGRGMLF